MEIFVAFDRNYHLLPVAFWFCILLVCSIVTFYFAVEKHSKGNSQCITILQNFVFWKNLLDTDPAPRILWSKVAKMILDKYFSFYYNLFRNAFRLRAPIIH